MNTCSPFTTVGVLPTAGSFFFLKQMRVTCARAPWDDTRSCVECGSHSVFLGWRRVAPGLAGQCSQSHACPASCGESALLVIKTVGCFSTFSSLSPLSFSGVKGLLFSFFPQIWLLITSQTLSRTDFYSSPQGVFVCLRQRVSGPESCISQSSCDGSIPPSTSRRSSASGWRWELQVCAWPARISVPGPLARGDATWGSHLLTLGSSWDRGRLLLMSAGLMTNTAHCSLSPLFWRKHPLNFAG